MSEIDFGLWEKEQAESEDGLLTISHTLNLAQELQYNLANLPPKLRRPMGMEALELLNGYPNDLRYHHFAFNLHHAYLNVHPSTINSEGHTSKYGAMRVLGQVGLYGLDRFDDTGWTLTLQLFEPVQLSVENERDMLPNRLPAPLKLPVAAIELPVIQVK